VIETVDSFLKFISEDRFPKLKIFALKMHSTFRNTHTPFLVLKLVNLLFYSLKHCVGSDPEVTTFL